MGLAASGVALSVVMIFNPPSPSNAQESNVCPNCKSATESTWQFCLACGETLREEPEDVLSDPAVPTDKQLYAYKRGKVKCWQCHEKLAAPSPACPACGADLVTPRTKTRKIDTSEPKGIAAVLPMPILISFALMGAIVIGGMGYLMSSGNQSSAEDTSEFNLPSLPDIDFGSMFGDDAKSADIPDGIDVNAIEGRAISVDDAGLITIRVEGHDVPVRLAGLADDYVEDCLGDAGLARTRRILSAGAVIFVYLDGPSRFVSQANIDPQSVYIWQYDPDTEKLRFVNNEILASGEAELQATELTDQAPAADLVSAAARAEEKLRGRFEPGACS